MLDLLFIRAGYWPARRRWKRMYQMRITGTSDTQQNAPSDNQRTGCRMTLSQLRHDIRNHLNAIKLSCALLQRRHHDHSTEETVREIDHAADSINELVTRFMGDADAPNLLNGPHHREAQHA